MHQKRLFIALLTAVFLFTSCSLVDKLKQKISSNKDSEDNKEKTKTEDTKEFVSGDDLVFYNTYIDVTNKIREAGDGVYKDYNSDVPEPGSVSKSSFIVAVSFKISADNLERVTKEYKRSYYDGGELSKLNAGADMKSDIEGRLKTLLTAMEDFQVTAAKVSAYYSSGDYKKDISNVYPYDEEMKTGYEKYKSAFDKFADAVKKHKPKKESRDPNSFTNPDERTAAILMNSYENTLDAAEEFYDAYSGVEYRGDLTKAKEKFTAFETTFKNDKNTVMSTEFSEKTKYMKYSYEDYFMKMTNMFLDAGRKFFDEAPSAKTENNFNTLYDAVVNNYNYMVTAYNTNINIVNTFRVY